MKLCFYLAFLTAHNASGAPLFCSVLPSRLNTHSITLTFSIYPENVWLQRRTGVETGCCSKMRRQNTSTWKLTNAAHTWRHTLGALIRRSSDAVFTVNRHVRRYYPRTSLSLIWIIFWSGVLLGKTIYPGFLCTCQVKNHSDIWQFIVITIEHSDGESTGRSLCAPRY